MKKALLHSYFYKDIYNSWGLRYDYLIQALLKKDFEVFTDFRMNFHCYSDDSYWEKLLNQKRLRGDTKELNPKHSPKFIGLNRIENTHFDLCIYNCADISETKTTGNEVNCDKKLFLKPTVPDEYQATLDPLGYGSYSSITYEKPNFESVDDDKVSNFYNTKVKSWINNNQSKWGQNHFGVKEHEEEDDYILILGQCGPDSVLIRQDFGSYLFRLANLIKELVKVTDKKIIFKLHPYTNGKLATIHSAGKPIMGDEEKIKAEFELLSPNLKVVTGFRSVHDFLPKANCVITGNSGAGFEAMMYPKPIISFCMPEYHWVTYDLRKPCDLWRALKTDDWFDAELNKKFLYWYMEEYCFFDQKSANKRLELLLNE